MWYEFYFQQLNFSWIWFFFLLTFSVKYLWGVERNVMDFTKGNWGGFYTALSTDSKIVSNYQITLKIQPNALAVREEFQWLLVMFQRSLISERNVLSYWFLVSANNTLLFNKILLTYLSGHNSSIFLSSNFFLSFEKYIFIASLLEINKKNFLLKIKIENWNFSII